MANTANQKKRRAERTRQFLEVLINRYPDCFSARRDAVRPLAVGIQQSLMEDLARDPEFEETPNWVVKQALARYTNAPSYLEAIMAGRSRIDLAGAEAGEVTDEAKAHARQRREEQKRRAAERRQERARSRRKGAPRGQPAQRKLERLADKFNDPS